MAADKARLTVIDYIGNHRAFLLKLRGIALIVDRDAETQRPPTRNPRSRSSMTASACPLGCEVTYDLAAIETFENLLRPTRSEEMLEVFYRDFEDRHGVRPTAIEAFHQVSIRAETASDPG